MAVTILYHIESYGSCTQTRYETEHFSGHGHKIIGLHHVQNALWNKNKLKGN